jgi:hypothetical protein
MSNFYLWSACVLAACSSLISGFASASPQTAHPDVRMAPGVYRCELNRQVHVRHISHDRRSAVLTWNKRDYRLEAVSTQSGAMRFEDRVSGLAWISIVDKSLLLDTRTGQQLANDCRS